MATPAKSNVIAFGAYEFNVVTRELRKSGMRMRLEGQPLTILEILLERRGELVTREELRNKLWPGETFVDFEHSLNAAVKRLRAALSDSAEHPLYIETQARRGYRFIAPVDAAGDDRKSLASNPPVSMEAARTGLTAWNWRLLGTIALCIVGLLFLVWHRWMNRSMASPVPGIHSLVVLPLKNLSGNPAQEYFVDGMTEELIGRLAKIRGLRVISRTSAMQFKDTRLSAPEIAQKLRVDALVEGSVIRQGDRVRVHAQLIRAATDEHFWSETYDRDLSDVLALQSDVAQAIAERVAVSLSNEERSRLVAARQVAPEVYESYLKGRFAVGLANMEGAEQSIPYFEDAIRKDETFAPAYLGLSNAYAKIGTAFYGKLSPEESRPKVIRYAQKALALDPDLVGAHVTLADALQEEWRWTEAEREYKRSLELNPNSAKAHAGFASWLLCHGRTQEAIEQVQLARSLDPDGVTGEDVSWFLFLARRFDEAIREANSQLAVHPEDIFTRFNLGIELIATDRPAEAIDVLEKAASLSARSPVALGLLVRAYAHAGRRNDALRCLAELKRRSKEGYIPPPAFVQAYLGLGDNEATFYWLERAYKEQSNILQYLKIHPYFDPIRSDPRFGNLLYRVGLD